MRVTRDTVVTDLGTDVISVVLVDTTAGWYRRVVDEGRRVTVVDVAHSARIIKLVHIGSIAGLVKAVSTCTGRQHNVTRTCE